MLSQELVEDRIRRGEVSIAYSFATTETDSVLELREQFVDLLTDDSPATQMFRKQFFGDRLTVTLGPIVMTHDRRYRRLRPAYKNRLGYFDIRQHSNTLTLEPYEVVSVATNERIRLNKRHGAYILPRLRNVDAGVLYIPSYIDPFWDGVLQAVIVNVTDERISLKLCEGLAICRFYVVAGEVPDDLRDRFIAKSHHIGQSWPAILEEDQDPFPRRKLPVPPRTIRALFHEALDALAGTFQRSMKTLGYTGGIIAIVVAATKLNSAADKIHDLDKAYTADIPTMKRSITAVKERLPQTGETEIALPKGEKHATVRLRVQGTPSRRSTAWAQVIGGTVAAVTLTDVALQPDSLDPASTNLVIYVETNGRIATVRIKWLVIL